jgi:hypothetical protein
VKFGDKPLKGIALDGKAAAVVVEHQPMSSYSVDAMTAQSFAGPENAGLLSSRVPRQRVLSVGGRGMGDAFEGEVVVLGSKTDEVRMVGWKKRPGAPGSRRDTEILLGWIKDGTP